MTEIEKKIESNRKWTKLCACIFNTSIGYYKTIGIVGGFIAGVCAVMYAILYAITTFGPSLISMIHSGAMSIPPIAYVIVAFLVGPTILATVVCLHKRKESEIQAIDKDFICGD